MTQQLSTVITTSPYSGILSFGHLIWWTVHQGIYDTDQLRREADKFNLPQVILDFLTGAKAKSAWERATNLRSQPIAAGEDVRKRIKYSYTTREIDYNTRVLIRETLDEANVRLNTMQIGVLSFDGGFCFNPELPYIHDPDLKLEADEVLSELQGRYYNRLDRVDDTKLRNTLLRWLEHRHRVAVRGNGGVYFIPNRKNQDKRDEVISEIMAIRDWLHACSLGTLTAIEIKDSETTTIVDIVQASVDEINEALDAVETSLKNYAQSENMNAGSRAEASRSQLRKMSDLAEKITALEESLGEKIGILGHRAGLLARRAKTMNERASKEVAEFRAAKGKS